MAFKRDNSNSTSNDNGIPANKKATGYLNLYLPNKQGGRRKLGAVILRTAYANEKELADWLAVDPVGRAAMILSQLQIEYNAATPDEASGFALPDADSIPGA